MTTMAPWTPAPLVASRLTRATRSDVKVSVPGATWVWPETLAAVQPGDQFLVFADLPADKPMRVELGDKGDDVREVTLTTSSRPSGIQPATLRSLP